MRNSCCLVVMHSHSHAPLLSGGPVHGVPGREPELLQQLLPGLHTWPFPNAQGALNHFLLLISALPLTAHQHLWNLHFILLYVLALWIFVGGRWGDWQTVVSLISELYN